MTIWIDQFNFRITFIEENIQQRLKSSNLYNLDRCIDLHYPQQRLFLSNFQFIKNKLFLLQEHLRYRHFKQLYK